MIKRILLILIFSCSLFLCKYGNENLGYTITYELDSTVCMYCRINSNIFYATSFVSNSYFPDSLKDHGRIEAYFRSEKMQLTLRSNMMLSQPKTKFPAYIKKDTLNYLLTTNEPFDLNFSILTDTLIIGNFLGKFVNQKNLADTLNISNGYFIIRPHIRNNFFLSLYLNKNYHQTNTGAEVLDKNIHYIQAIDTTFQDSLTAKMQFVIKTFSDDFIQEFKIDQHSRFTDVNLLISSKITGQDNVYSGYSGSIKVIALDNIIRRGVWQERLANFTFEVEVRNNNDEIVQITDGNFSSTGF